MPFPGQKQGEMLAIGMGLMVWDLTKHMERQCFSGEIKAQWMAFLWMTFPDG